MNSFEFVPQDIPKLRLVLGEEAKNQDDCDLRQKLSDQTKVFLSDRPLKPWEIDLANWLLDHSDTLIDLVQPGKQIHLNLDPEAQMVEVASVVYDVDLPLNPDEHIEVWIQFSGRLVLEEGILGPPIQDNLLVNVWRQRQILEVLDGDLFVSSVIEIGNSQ